MVQTFQQTGIMSQAELVRFGYAAATKRERKDFELPEFCLHDVFAKVLDERRKRPGGLNPDAIETMLRY